MYITILPWVSPMHHCYSGKIADTIADMIADTIADTWSALSKAALRNPVLLTVRSGRSPAFLNLLSILHNSDFVSFDPAPPNGFFLETRGLPLNILKYGTDTTFSFSFLPMHSRILFHDLLSWLVEVSSVLTQQGSSRTVGHVYNLGPCLQLLVEVARTVVCVGAGLHSFSWEMFWLQEVKHHWK